MGKTSCDRGLKVKGDVGQRTGLASPREGLQPAGCLFRGCKELNNKTGVALEDEMSNV